MKMVNTGRHVSSLGYPQSCILCCLYLLEARVTCVGAPDWWPSGHQFRHSGGVCPQIQGWQCDRYVDAVCCVVCVGVTEGA